MIFVGFFIGDMGVKVVFRGFIFILTNHSDTNHNFFLIVTHKKYINALNHNKIMSKPTPSSLSFHSTTPIRHSSMKLGSCTQLAMTPAGSSNGGSRKFIRRRDSSNQSLKRSEGHTPKSVNGSVNGEGSVRGQAVIDVGFSSKIRYEKILKIDSYVKLLNGPTISQTGMPTPNPVTTPTSKISLNTSMPTNPKPVPLFTNSQQQQLKLDVHKITIKQNLSTPYSTPRTIRRDSDTANRQDVSYRVLTSTRNAKKTSKQFTKYDVMDIDVDIDGGKQGEGYQYAQTEREQVCRGKGNNGNGRSKEEIKILENQILILEDEILRLKKWVNQVLVEKEAEKAKRIQMEKQWKASQEKAKGILRANYQVAYWLERKFQEIYLEIDKSSHQGTAINRNRMLTNWNYLSSLVKNKDKPQRITPQPQIDLRQFQNNFLEPACIAIQDSFKQYSKILCQSKLSLKKIQIKQDIMMRNQYQVKTLKNEVKQNIQKYIYQKNRVIRYKEMYQKLRKQYNDLKLSASPSQSQSNSENSKKNCERKHSPGGKNTKYNGGQDDVSFSLSDLSDEEGCRKKKMHMKKN